MPVSAALLGICIVPPTVVIFCVVFLNYLNRQQLVEGTERFEPAKTNEICIALQTIPACHLRSAQSECVHESDIPSLQSKDAITRITTGPQRAHSPETIAMTAMQAPVNDVAAGVDSITTPDASGSLRLKGSRARTRPLNASSYYSPFDDIADSCNTSFLSRAKSGRSGLSKSNDGVHLLQQSSPLSERAEDTSAYPTSGSPLASPDLVHRYSWEEPRIALNKLSTITEVATRPSDPESLSQIRPHSSETIRYGDLTYDRSRDSSVRGPYHYDYV